MNNGVPSEKENPYGLNGRYIITKADGSPTDPRAVYFVLRLDSFGDPAHVHACREAAEMYACAAEDSLSPIVERIGEELYELVAKLKKEPTP